MKGKFTPLRMTDQFFLPGQPLRDFQLNSMALQVARLNWHLYQPHKLDQTQGRLGNRSIPMDFRDVTIDHFDSDNPSCSVWMYLFEGNIRYRVESNKVIGQSPPIKCTVKRRENSPPGPLLLELAVEYKKDGTEPKLFLKWSNTNASRIITEQPSLDGLSDGPDTQWLDIEDKAYPGISLGVVQRGNVILSNHSVRVWDGIRELEFKDNPVTVDIADYLYGEFAVEKTDLEKYARHYWIVTENPEETLWSECDRVWPAPPISPSLAIRSETPRRGTTEQESKNSDTPSSPVNPLKNPANDTPSEPKPPQPPPTVNVSTLSATRKQKHALGRWLSSMATEELRHISRDDMLQHLTDDLGLKKRHLKSWTRCVDQFLLLRDQQIHPANDTRRV